MGENVWRGEPEWPLARTRYTPFYLRSAGRANSGAGDGRLTRDAPSAPEPADAYVYDPRDPVPSRGGAMLSAHAGIALQNDIEKRADVLVYTGKSLEQDVEVTGPLSAVLHVATDAASTDFTVKLVDVHPDGNAYNVSDGILRRSYPQPAQSPTEITIELWPTSMLFRRDHRIRVEVSSSNYPRYDRNPNTGGDVATQRNPMTARQSVHQVRRHRRGSSCRSSRDDAAPDAKVEPAIALASSSSGCAESSVSVGRGPGGCHLACSRPRQANHRATALTLARGRCRSLREEH